MDDETFRVLFIEDEPAVREVVDVRLGRQGVETLAVASLAAARAVLDEPFEAVILGRSLPDGPGDDLVGELLERLPRSRIIVHSSEGTIDGLPSVSDCDTDTIAELLGLTGDGGGHPAADRTWRAVGRIHREWLQLCRWDPELPPSVRPAIPEEMIGAVAQALDRPQPLAWGLDPAIESVAVAFASDSEPLGTALAQLVCLREAFVRVVIDSLEDDRDEALHRLHMIIDRVMVAVAAAEMRAVCDLARIDELTGLGNRRAFDEDLAKEVERSRRSGARLTVAMIDVDGLKQVNDRAGHGAGDDVLRRVANAIRVAIRAADRGYRVGGDEFALILADSAKVDEPRLRQRLTEAGCPSVTVGTASLPDEDPEHLMEVADTRLYAKRGLRPESAS